MVKTPMKTLHSSSWDRTRLLALVSKMKKKKILVLGDVGIDRYTVGSVERISPEAPVPVVLVNQEILKLGLAANVADNIRALGGTPYLLGVLGKDRRAADFCELLLSQGISDEWMLRDSTRCTALKERVVSESQQLLRIDYESLHGISKEIERKLLEKVSLLLKQVDGVIVEDYAKGLLTPGLAQGVFEKARAQGKWVALDPNVKTPVALYRGADVLTPNQKEAEHLAGMKITDPASLLRAGQEILNQTQARAVVITRGKDGMAIFDSTSSQVQLIPTFAKEVYDVSGAGDTVISVLMLALVSGASLGEACILGNLAAGVEVGKRGTATVSPGEIREALKVGHA
ncbi:MAG: D-glycero-beta-D-manno-heptose-7-phosphate kinase [Bdellovibrionia bacterium]